MSSHSTANATAMHPNVHLHFTLTYSSWLNQVECWLSILSRTALRGASFTSPGPTTHCHRCLRQCVQANATPFE
jgi:transposase